VTNEPASNLAWRTLRDRRRPWWRRLSSQTLAQTEVFTPDAERYLVRVSRNSPIKTGTGVVDDAGQGIGDLVVANLKARGRTGWTVKVVAPAAGRRAERELFRQEILAGPIVADVALAVVAALERGDALWDED
jgi:hypothetical protein